MTNLLISVKNIEEANIALKFGVDIIDLKDPEMGALGALSIDTTSAILKEIRQHALVSATVGETHIDVNHLIKAIQARINVGVDIIKLAFSPIFEEDEFATKIKSMTDRNIRLVCVFFADHMFDLNKLKLLKKLGFYGAMLDTQSKSQTLTEIKSTQHLADFTNACGKNGLISGLAGSLNHHNVAKLLDNCSPDFVGFRGGVCHENQRNASLVGERLQALHELLLNHNRNADLSPNGLDIALHS